MTNETKNVTFHVIHAKVSSDSMFKNFTNECCNRECMLWLREKFVQGLDFVKDEWKAWSNMIKGRALY